MSASKYFFLFLLVLFGSCKGLSDRKIVGRYFLVAVDYENSQTCLSYEIGNDESFAGVVGPMIFAVGYDNRFIILKQHPVKLIPHSTVDETITNYYIVAIPSKYTDIPNDKNVYGPFDERQFFAKRKEFGVSDLIKFTISIDE
jgi:hypothetical protein